jgi:MFS family permease
VIIGNGLEFYDFVTFAFFAIQIGHTFFPSTNAYLSLMGSLATFGAGFITRPIGAHVLGGYADRAGRKPAMLISMTLMGVGILLLALTPGYATIGIAAPLLALTARLMQGFALGGEVGSATAYMMESAKDERRGLTISWQSISQQISATTGALVGLGLSLTLTKLQLDLFGWRIALLLGATIVPFALFMRNGLPETAVTQTGQTAPFRSYRRVIGLGALIITAGTIATYVFHYMTTYGQNSIHLSSSAAFAGQTANQAIGIIAAMLGGWLSDRIGRRWVMIVPQSAFLLAIIPCFVWLTTARSATAFIGANLILSVAYGVPFGATYAAITESLPSMVRARAFALVYSVPVAVFGGTTQLVVTWLLHVTGNPMAIGWYLAAVTGIGLLAMIAMRESAPIRLRQMALAYQ